MQKTSGRDARVRSAHGRGAYTSFAALRQGLDREGRCSRALITVTSRENFTKLNDSLRCGSSRGEMKTSLVLQRPAPTGSELNRSSLYATLLFADPLKNVAISIQYYVTPDDKVPAKKWLKSLKDVRARNKIDSRIARARTGNLGDHATGREGVIELRINYGPGYRLYVGQVGALIIILFGGDKSGQDADLARARAYWKDYKSRAEKG